MEFDLKAYYERVGLEAGLEKLTQAQLLDAMHYAHITHIPFENLDVLGGKPIDVSPQAVFDKLVTNHRGGYCFEMNCLFCEAVKAAGMEAYGVLARVSRGNGFSGYSHRMNIVKADGRRYICDVGFGGDCFTHPLLFELELEQQVQFNRYRVVKGEQVEYSVQILRGDKYEDMLGFNDSPAFDDDFAICSFYTGSHPTSVFKYARMLNLFTETGRYSMFGDDLTIQDGDKVTRSHLEPDKAKEAESKYFGLTV